jgi:hypothetical protein
VPAQDAMLQHTSCWQKLGSPLINWHSDPAEHGWPRFFLHAPSAGRPARAGALLAGHQAHVVQSRNVRVAELTT